MTRGRLISELLQSGALTFLAGGGEMGERIRSFDWASTSLGAPEHWPQSLKTSIRIMLMSRQPVWIGWGQDLLYFYNDPYFSIIGGKHPWALGRPTREVWSEIWDVISPMLATAMSGDEGTYVESQLLIMERNGYPEETYYTFSYSPIPDDRGEPGGIFCANSDDTQRVVGQRELALLRDLAAKTAKSRTPQEAALRSASALSTNPQDIPFAAIYQTRDDGIAYLEAVSGIEAGHRLAPASISLEDPQFDLSAVLQTRSPKMMPNLGDASDLPTGAWPVPPRQGIILPLSVAGEAEKSRFLLVGLSPYRLYEGSYESFLNLVAGQIASAISDAEAIERERQRLDALAELDRAKTAFFANVSHEFRTPLTLMLGPLQDVLSHDLGIIPAGVHRELDTVRRNGLRLQKLVNTLLDFSRLEAGHMRAEFRPTDIATYSAQLASTFQSAIERAGLRLEVDCHPLASSDRPYVDRDLWEKVVLNLLSNSFKHTFEGSIRLSVRKSADSVELSLTDTGIGIPAADLPHLFERFRRVEGVRSRTHEGSGIGLALVQEIVCLHGGEIQATSETDGPDRGTTFRIRIPMGKDHLPPSEVHENLASDEIRTDASIPLDVASWLGPEDAGSDLDSEYQASEIPVRTSGARILIAEDNGDMRAYLARLLSRSYSVESVGNGQEALETIRQHRPDLLVTDVMMPTMDGFALIEAVRSNMETAHLPIIMLSARAGEEARIEGLDAGADDYLVKPFSARELIARVDSVLSLSRHREEATQALRSSEERLRVALGAARMIAWEWNSDTNAFSVSGDASSVLGHRNANSGLSRKEFHALIHPEDASSRVRYFETAVENEGGNYDNQFRLIRPVDGKTVWLEENGVVTRDSDGRLMAKGVWVDITARRRAEDERADAQAMLAAEKRILEAVTSGLDLSEVLERLARETEGLSKEGMLCSVLLLDESGKHLLHGAGPSLPKGYNAAIHGVAIGPSVGSCGTAAYRREAVTVEDLANDPLWADFKELAVGYGLRSCSSRPVFGRVGQILGTVAMYYRQPHRPGAFDEEVTQRAARLAGLVIERDRALAAVEAERTRYREFFNSAPALIAILKGPEHVFELVNSAYLQSIGNPPAEAVLRRRLRDVLPEIESQGILAILDEVYATGRPFQGNEIKVQLRRGGDESEDVYFNFVYQPSRGADGSVDGIAVLAIDVTEQVAARSGG